MSDLISRQAAIDSPVKMVSEGLEWIPVYHIKELPSAEPEVRTQMSSADCISRQAAIDAVNAHYDDEYFNFYTVMDILKQLPSAQPEIIRCKDCKYWREDHTCKEHSLVSPMLANDFCSRAERREDG